MGFESIIELIQRRITPMDSERGEVNITRTFHKDDYKSLDNIIDLLKSGEKLKKILESFEDLYGQYTILVEGNNTTIKKLIIDMEIDNGYYLGEKP